jgi:hypothetical protein
LPFRLNRPSRCARYLLRHASCHRSRSRPADISAAWRPSLQTVVDPAFEPQPHPGAPSGAAAGPAGRAAVTAPHSGTAALSNARGIEAPRAGVHRTAPEKPRRKPQSQVGPRLAAQSQTTPPHGAMQRGRPMTGKIWRTTPPSPAATSAATPTFQRANVSRQIPLGALNLFRWSQTKLLPGTLHHSGNRPAPPSEDIPLARRSAFCACGNRTAGEFGRARGVESLQQKIPPCRWRGENLCPQMRRADRSRAEVYWAPADALIARVPTPPALRRRPAGVRSNLK